MYLDFWYSRLSVYSHHSAGSLNVPPTALAYQHWRLLEACFEGKEEEAESYYLSNID